MGNPIDSSDDFDGELDEEVARCIKAIKDFSPRNIKSFLETLFSGMSLAAKETVVDILWASMTLREQHLFDMPTNDRRLTDEEMHRNFGSSEINIIPRRVVRGLQRVEPQSVSRSLRTRTGITHIWPRIGLNRMIESTSNEVISAPESRVEGLDPSRRRIVSESRPGDIGDHILTILMDVVMRAEQNAERRAAGDRTQDNESEDTLRRSRQ